MPYRLDRPGHPLPFRRRTLLGGVGLALILLTALTLLGVLGPRSGPPPAETVLGTDSDTRTAVQPELKAALLQPDDLPDTYNPHHTAVNRPITPATPTASATRQPERCGALLGAPDELVRRAAAVVGPVPQARAQVAAAHSGPARSLLDQVLTSFTGNGAGATFDELRRMGRRCRDFGAVLQDGIAVRVRVQELTEDQLSQPSRPLLRVQGERFALKLTVTGGARTMIGYLALGHADRVLSVLRRLEPEQAGGQESFLGLLDAAARKLSLLPPK